MMVTTTSAVSMCGKATERQMVAPIVLSTYFGVPAHNTILSLKTKWLRS